MTPQPPNPNNFESRGEGTAFLPETQLERQRLVEQIDTQLEIWAAIARTNHFPAMAQTTLADVIVRNCTPKEKTPEEIVASLRFKEKWSPQEAEAHLLAEERLCDIAQLAGRAELDTTAIEDRLFNHWFTVAESYIETLRPSPAYSPALRSLKRLYIAREQLESSPLEPHLLDEMQNGFAATLRRLIEDL